MLKSFKLVVSIAAFIFCIQVLSEERNLSNDNPVFEIVKWKSKSDISDEAMVDAVNSMVVDLRSLKGFLHQSLYKNSSDEWVDIYYWETEMDAHASNTSMADKASFKKLIELIELNSVSIEVMHQLQSSGEQSFGK